MKQQNQATDQGPRSRKDHSMYRHNQKKGIKSHKQLHDFYDLYAEKLIAGQPPPDKVVTYPLYSRFWEAERLRYELDPNHWYPLATELYLATPTMRGIIDRIDPVDANSCRVVEYKSSPEKSGYLKMELLFYALLVTECESFQKESPRVVTEAACYYYSTGKMEYYEVTNDDFALIKEELAIIREELLTPNWSSKFDCQLLRKDCSYAVVCTKIPPSFLKDVV